MNTRLILLMKEIRYPLYIVQEWEIISYQTSSIEHVADWVVLHLFQVKAHNVFTMIYTIMQVFFLWFLINLFTLQVIL